MKKVYVVRKERNKIVGSHGWYQTMAEAVKVQSKLCSQMGDHFRLACEEDLK